MCTGSVNVEVHHILPPFVPAELMLPDDIND